MALHLSINNMLHRNLIMPKWQGVVFSSFIVANETPDRLISHKNTLFHSKFRGSTQLDLDSVCGKGRKNQSITDGRTSSLVSDP